MMDKFSEQLYRWKISPFQDETGECSSQIAVFHDVWVHPAARGLGIGQKQHLTRLAEAKRGDYRYVMCSVRADNDVERHILAKNGWKELDVFAGQVGDVVIYGKELT